MVPKVNIEKSISIIFELLQKLRRNRKLEKAEILRLRLAIQSLDMFLSDHLN